MNAPDVAASRTNASKPAISFFERYLTVWVALCIVAGILLGQLLPGVFQAIGRMEVAQVNLPVGLLIWVMIIPMLVKVDFGSLHEVRHIPGNRRHAHRELASQAFYDGVPRLAVHQAPVRANATCGAARQLRGRPDPAGRGALHGDGVCLESSHRRRPALHALAGRAQRQHYGGRVCTARWPAARHFRHHGTVGNAAHLGRALHRHSGDPRANPAQAVARQRGGRV